MQITKEKRLKRIPSIRPRHLQELLTAEAEEREREKEAGGERRRGQNSSSSSMEEDSDNCDQDRIVYRAKAPILKTSNSSTRWGKIVNYVHLVIVILMFIMSRSARPRFAGEKLSVPSCVGHSVSNNGGSSSSRLKEKRQRHFTLASPADSDEVNSVVQLRHPRKASPSSVGRVAPSPSKIPPHRHHQRHTLFDAEPSLANGNGSSRRRGGVQSMAPGPVNFDIEAVRLDHSRKAWGEWDRATRYCFFQHVFLVSRMFYYF